MIPKMLLKLSNSTEDVEFVGPFAYVEIGVDWIEAGSLGQIGFCAEIVFSRGSGERFWKRQGEFELYGKLHETLTKETEHVHNG